MCKIAHRSSGPYQLKRCIAVVHGECSPSFSTHMHPIRLRAKVQYHFVCVSSSKSRDELRISSLGSSSSIANFFNLSVY